MLGCSSVWTITSEEFSQRRMQFENLAPITGFITGLQAKEFFTRSNLSNSVLCQIWNLADYDKDGRMNLHEFSIAMHLIKRRLEGVELPSSLPKEMMVPPTNFAFPDVVAECGGVGVAPSYAEVMQQQEHPPLPRRSGPRPASYAPSTSQVTHQHSVPAAGTGASGEWAIMQAVRPRYRLQFNQQDRQRRGYLTGEEAKAVLLRSGLPNGVLVHIWALSDVDRDGKLTCEEFCVAMYLVEQARAGRQLPTSLPDSLVPPSMLTSAAGSGCGGGAPPEWTSHRQESRPGTLRATPHSPQVTNNNSTVGTAYFSFRGARHDSDLFSISSSQRSGSRCSEPDMLQHQQQHILDVESSKLRHVVEEREKEKELLNQLKQRQQQLIEALGEEEVKCRQFQMQLRQSMQNVEARKSHIENMRGERDRIVESTACLSEQLEAARAEQHRCRRDKSHIEQQQAQAQPATNGHCSVEEGIDDIEQKKQDRERSIESLQREIQELEASISARTESYSLCSTRLQRLRQTADEEQLPEIEKLRTDVAQRRGQVHQMLHGGPQATNLETEEDLPLPPPPTGARSGPPSHLPVAMVTTLFEDDLTNTKLIATDSAIMNATPVPAAVTTSATTPMATELIDKYVAQHSFIGRQADELSFNLGDLILVKSDPTGVPAGWLCGRLETSEFYGLFPEIYVKLVTTPASPLDEYSMHQQHHLFDKTLPQGSTIKKAPGGAAAVAAVVVEALFPWMLGEDTADQEAGRGQLSFGVGQRIRVLEQPGEDWWRGELLSSGSGSGGRVGWFPRIYVQTVSTDDNTDGSATTRYSNLSFAASNDISGAPVPSCGSGGSTHSSGSGGSGGSGREYCLALYPYESSVPGDLTMRPGDIIQLLEPAGSSQDGRPWWKGHLRGARETTGLFPAHYVKRLTQQELEDTGGLLAMTSEYYTSLTSDETAAHSTADSNQSAGTGTASAIYEDIDPSSSFHSPATVSPNDNEEVLSGRDEPTTSSSTYSNYCSLASDHGTQQPTAAMANARSEEAESSSSGGGPPSPSPLALVVRDHEATSPSQLSCRAGQQVCLLDYSAGAVLCLVRLDSASGWVPRDCVDPLDPPAIRHGVVGHHRGAADLMTASGYDQCLAHSATSGTTVTAVNTGSGSSRSSSTRAVAEPVASGPEEDHSTPRIGQLLIAMYPYSAQNPDELSFCKNSVIRLVSKDEPDWWKGSTLVAPGSGGGSGSGTGLFPVNYVRRPDPENEQDTQLMAKFGGPNGRGFDSSGPGGAEEELTNAYSTVSGRPISWYIDGQVSFNALLTDDEKRRQFYIIELIETEKTYYDDLQEVHRVFYEPIRKANILTPEDLRHIFLNWTDLIAKSYNFFMALKIRQDLAGFKQPIQCVGDILLSNFPNFIVYVRFCSMQNHAIVVLQRRKQSSPEFRQFCDSCETNLRCQKMPMTSYFLKPMQRITKYKLLVENILKYTEEGHPDRGDMEEAVAAARSLCEAVNEGIREKENSERLEWMQDHIGGGGLADVPGQATADSATGGGLCFNSATNSLGHRKLVYSGTLSKAKSGKELVGFLCNDFLLLATPTHNTNGCPFVFPLETSGGSKMAFKIYKKPILLNRVLIMTGVPSNQNSLSVTASTSVFGSVSNNEIFTVREAGTDHVLKALSVNDRDKWVERLVAASLQYIEIENSVREISMSIRRSAGVGRLIVTILEGCNLKASQAMAESRVHAYCEVSLGNQLRRTKVVTATFNPKWQCHMQFLIKNLELDVLCLSVHDKEYFAPNEYMGRTEVAVKEIKRLKQRGPVERRLKLMGVNSGELFVRFDIALFRSD